MDRFISALIVVGKLIICYQIAALVLYAYVLWPNFGGASHVPFSSFPWSLIWSPFIPIMTIAEIRGVETDPENVKEILIFAAALVASFAALFWLPRFRRKDA